MLNKFARFLIVGLPLALLVALHSDFVPVWDSYFYMECIEKHDPLKFHGFWLLNCAGHPSTLYLSPLALVYQLTGGALWSVYAVNVLFGLLAVAAFLALLDTLYPEVSNAERMVTAATVASLPPLAGSALNINPDFGVVVFFLMMLGAMVSGRPYLAGLASGILVVSKETGIVLWGVSLGVFLLTTILRREGSVRHKALKVLSNWPLLAGGAVFAWYAWLRISFGQPIFWDVAAKTGGPLLQQLTTFSLFEPHFQAYLAGIFTVNFAWIPTLFMLVGVVVWAIGKAFGANPKPHPARREFVVLLFPLTTYLLTRHVTFLNLRYVLPLMPLVILGGFHAIQSLIPIRAGRIVCLSVILLLTLVSCFRTLDPVSKKLFGTFEFGEHKMLTMTSISKECCGLGRDQLVYNLEFVQYHRIINDILADLRPTMSEPLTTASQGGFLKFVTPTDPPQRSSVQTGTLPAPVMFYDQIGAAAVRPPKVAWITMPYFAGEPEHISVRTHYQLVEERKYQRGGYYLTVEMLSLK